MRALIIVDVQNDFTKGGSLEVPDGDAIIPVINELQTHFKLVIATQDWHPPDHKSFASNNAGKKPFETILLNGQEQVLWPDHCVQGSEGAVFHRDLDMNSVSAIFRKGMDPEVDSYSGFFDNDHQRSTGLNGFLCARQINEVFVCGLAGDYCVYFTARDGLNEGFETYLIADATRPIDKEGFDLAMEEIQKIGGKIVFSREIKNEL